MCLLVVFTRSLKGIMQTANAVAHQCKESDPGTSKCSYVQVIGDVEL